MRVLLRLLCLYWMVDGTVWRGKERNSTSGSCVFLSVSLSVCVV